MKFNSKLIISTLAIILITSCESHEIKADEPFEKFKAQKLLEKDSEMQINETIIAPKKIIIIQKMEAPDEWSKLKKEIEKKIQANENTIKELKNNSTTNAKTLKKLTRLEENNDNLKMQIDEYCIEVKLKLEKFKTKMKQDVDDLGNELKDIQPADKKQF